MWRDTRPAVLCLSVSGGAGHVRAAEALCATGRQHFSSYRFEHRDLLAFAGKPVKDAYNYVWRSALAGSATNWTRLYSKCKPFGAEPITYKDPRGVVGLLALPGLLHELRSIRPEAIIATHYLPAQMCAELDYAPWMQVTDYGINPWWVQSGVQGYFASCTHAAEQLTKRGVPADRVYVTGIPVMPAFFVRYDQKCCKQNLSLNPLRPVVTVAFGGDAPDRVKSIVARLLELPQTPQVAVVCGKSHGLLKYFVSLARRGVPNLHPFGFVSNIVEFYTAADVVVAKPGGLTTSECLAVGVPLVVETPTAPHEIQNVVYLQQSRAGFRGESDIDLAYLAGCVLALPEATRTAWRREIQAVGKPYAALDVLRRVLVS